MAACCQHRRARSAEAAPGVRSGGACRRLPGSGDRSKTWWWRSGPRRPSAPVRCGSTVSACGVNYVEGLMVQGLYQVKIPAPFTPGMEMVGRITEVAADVDGVALGERVFVNVGIGGYVSEVVVAAERCVALPDTMTDGQAATFMQSYLTGWFALTQRITTTPGQRLLVLGAGGGVGLAAVDIGTALGLEVYAAASNPEKLELARAAGATVADRLVVGGRQGPGAGAVRGRSRPPLRPRRRRARRGLPARPRRRGHLPGDRLRRWHPAAAGQPDPAAQPTGGGGRVGRVGHAATRHATRS